MDQPGLHSIREAHKAMLALRREHSALRTNRSESLDASEPVLAFRRGELLCAFTLSPSDAFADLPEGEALLAQDTKWEEGVPRLGPNGAVIGVVR